MALAREKLPVNESAARREELKNFLRNRRARLSPVDFGFKDGTRRRTPGLRRDEVAQLANIGTTTYTFLEQGRDIHVSTDILEKLAEVLRLNEQEKRHLFRLAAGELPPENPPSEHPAPALEEFLRNLGTCLAIILNNRFDIIATNEAGAIIFGHRPTSGAIEENSMWRMFNNPTRKSFYENWDVCAKSYVAYFRWNYGKYIGDQRLAEFVQALEESSEEFRQIWDNYEVFDASKLEMPLHINHPKLGRITGHYVLLAPFGYPNFTVCALTPDPSTDTAEKIERFLRENRP